MAHFLCKRQRIKQSMNVTFHECVLNVMTAPNPTQMGKLGKYEMKVPKYKRSKLLTYMQLRIFWSYLYMVAVPASRVARLVLRPMCFSALELAFHVLCYGSPSRASHRELGRRGNNITDENLTKSIKHVYQIIYMSIYTCT